MSGLPRGGPRHRLIVMGVLNVTSDSFSDGGRYLDHDAAIAHGVEMRRLGADIVDVGGESTRPGAVRVDPKIEAARVAPVIADLVADGIRVSVDTMRAVVASAAIEAGASIVNDVSGGRADPDMARVVADAKVPWILMHWRSATAGTGAPQYLHTGAVDHYGDVVEEVRAELMAQVEVAVGAGVDPTNLVLDPGLGFAKNAEHNWALLAALPELADLGFPVLIGASRKRFLGSLLAENDQVREPDGRETATAVISALAAVNGAWGVRVHDVRGSVDALAVTNAWEYAQRLRGSSDV